MNPAVDKCKSGLVITTIICLLLSILLFAFGLTLDQSFYGRSPLLRNFVSAPATAAICFGLLTFFITSFTLLGLCTGRKNLIYMISFMLLFILGLELGVSFACSLTQQSLLHLIGDSLRSSQSKYLTNASTHATWDSIQRNVGCCGVDSYREWYAVLKERRVPNSCCINYRANCGEFAVELRNIYTTSCTSAIKARAVDHHIPSIALYVVIIILQISTLLLMYGYVSNLQNA